MDDGRTVGSEKRYSAFVLLRFVMMAGTHTLGRIFADKLAIRLFVDNGLVDSYNIDVGFGESGLVCFKFGVRVC
jgi:hypothetical protein